MQTVDEKPETIHLYVVREETPKPPVFPILLSVLTLSLLLIYCVLAPYRQPELRVVIRVPAVFLPIQNFRISVADYSNRKKDLSGNLRSWTIDDYQRLDYLANDSRRIYF